ncbi:MAG: winged helix-turn-helix transcriptional regulator [Chloroflexi bacterium]|nr:winged helix-turn-helix transcriptional regulator [Chloroflexota bacterium]
MLNLNAGIKRKLTLVTAPAGFGKTTVVTQWLSQQDLPIAWLSLDKNDNDLTRFLSYFVAALQRVSPQIGTAAHALLRSPQPPSPSVLLTLLINNIVAEAAPFILVLDDYHVIDAQAVHDGLTFFLEHMPSIVHLVITSRTDPPLPLSRLRVRQQLNEIREAALRFSLAEATAFLNESMDLSLSVTQVTALAERTEGWIASLQLAALAMQAVPNRDNIDHFLDAFTGSHHYIVDYLLDEVLQQCTPEIQHFLLQTAVLNRFCAPLCAAVTGQPDCQTTLTLLQRQNLFVVPLDDQRQWYRYHHLFAAALRQQVSLSDQIVGHRRAAQWYYDQPNMMDEAIYHGLQAGDAAQTAQWIAATAPGTLWGRGEATKLQRQIEGLPANQLAHYPQLAAFLAWAYYIRGELQQAKIVMAQAVAAREGRVDVATQKLITGLATALQAFVVRAQGDFEQSIQLSERALTQLVDHSKMLQAILYFNLGAAYDHIGRLTQAREASQKLLKVTEGTDNTYLRLEAMGGLAYVTHEQGQLHQAYDICQEALQMVGKRPLPGVAIIHSQLANLLYEWNKLEQADVHASEAIALAKQSGLLSVLPFSYFRRAVIALHREDKTAVDHYRQQILQVNQKIPTSFLDTLLKILIADLDLRSHHVDRAWRWLQTTDLLTRDLSQQANTLEMYPFIVSAQIAIEHCRVHSDAALLATTIKRLHQLQQIVINVGHIQFQIKIQLLLTLAYKLQKDDATTLAILSETLLLAEPAQHCRIFIDLGVAMAGSLQLAQKKGIAPDYTARLLENFVAEKLIPNQQERLVTPEFALAEPLHKQELAILRLIAAGLTNRQIAEERFLSVNTVKWYIKRLYEKLAVHNRIEAIARAAELDLLSHS